MNTDNSSLFASLTLDNVLSVVLVVAILGACGTGFVEVVRMMTSVA
jgi:hypothetical protein